MIRKLMLFLFPVQVLCAGAKEPEPDLFDRISGNIILEHFNSVPDARKLDSLALAYAASMTPEGYWKDIPYDSRAQTEWLPSLHLDRLLVMAASHVSSANGCVRDEDLYENIVAGLEWWSNADPRSSNWWYQWVDTPQKTGLILILMRRGGQGIPDRLETELLSRMETVSGRPDEPGSRGTGANKIDVALHWVYRGVLKRDMQTLETGLLHAFAPLEFTTAEGLQHDYSYLQHGPQLYIGGYGEVFLDKVSYVASIVGGTRFMLSQPQIEALSGFMLQCFLPSIRARWINFNAVGRSISRVDALKKENIEPILKRMERLDPAHGEAYRTAISRLSGIECASFGVDPAHRHFWRADYTLSVTDGGTFDVRMVSRRTRRNENGNGENILGYFLSDGAASVRTDGDEYEGIFPLWDWSMIPGTTTPHLDQDEIPIPQPWGTPGTGLFAGGVSDGSGGITAYLYDDTTHRVRTKAEKSWFFFGEEILCLGSGITSQSDRPVHTTVNQTSTKGDIVISSEGSVRRVAEGSTVSASGTDWIFHNGIGYVFPEGGRVCVSDCRMTGDWKNINSNTESKTTAGNMLKIWLDHGTMPYGGRYTYIVLNTVEGADAMSGYDPRNIEIREQSSRVHAVYHARLARWYFVFFGAGIHRSGDISVSVDRPCILTVGRDAEKRTVVDIASPEQIHEHIKVEISFADGVTNVINAEFPVADAAFAGATKRYIPE